MQQQATNVIDFTAYRRRREEERALPTPYPFYFVQGPSAFAVPVLMPMMIAWLPIWGMAGTALSSRVADA